MIKRDVTDIEKSYYGLRDRIKRIRKGKGFDHFENWLNKNSQYDNGIRRATVFTSQTYLKRIVEGGKSPDIKLETKVYQADKFVKATDAYFSSMDENVFSNKEWYLYFLSIAERRSKHPKFARVVLKTENGRDVALKNVKDGYSENYTGTFRKLNDHNVLVFDLTNLEETRHLHIKASYLRHSDQVILGTYITFDGQRVSSGSLLLLQDVDNNTEARKETTKSIKTSQIDSYVDDTFESSEDEKTIASYLSIKSRNYYLVPKPLPNLEEVKDYLESYSPLSNKRNRFLESKKPLVYIATPQTSVNKDEMETCNDGKKISILCEELKTLLPNVEIYKKESGIDSTNESGKFSSLTLLRRTRFFILILTDTSKASFALVQLGWAMAYCKYLMIVHKHNKVSSRIEAIDNTDINKYTYNSIEDDSENIKKAIENFINRHM